MAWHNHSTKDWGALLDRSINPSAIPYKPKINSGTVQEERKEARELVATGEQEGEEQKVEEGDMGQAIVPDDSRADLYVYIFWKWGTTALFDMRIVNLDTVSYLRQTSAKALATAEK